MRLSLLSASYLDGTEGIQRIKLHPPASNTTPQTSPLSACNEDSNRTQHGNQGHESPSWHRHHPDDDVVGLKIHSSWIHRKEYRAMC